MENWIVVPLHNALPLTQAALESFLAQDIEGGVRVFFINNGSLDNTAPWLAGLNDERIEFVHVYPQRGVSHAWNLGLRRVFSGAKAGYALVANSDVVLAPDTYRILVGRAFASDPPAFTTGVGSDDRAAVDSSYQSRKRNDAGNWTARPHPDFSCFVIPAEVFSKAGPFDEKFRGAYGEDADYHCRMHKAGISAISVPLPFLHVERGSGSIKSCDDRGAELIGEQAARNRAYFKEKWGMEIGTEEYYAFFR